MNGFIGIPVVVDYDRPGYVLPQDVPVSPEFREKFNVWAAGFFKSKPSFIADGEVLTINPHGLPGLGPKRFHMNERTFAEFRKQADIESRHAAAAPWLI